MVTNRISIGDKFGRLTVIKLDHGKRYVRNGKEYVRKAWLCKCDCGNMSTVREDQLLDKTKPVRSCGCLQRDVASQYMKTHHVPPKHGDSHERIHNIWYLMLYRCNNANTKAYKNYGGRGISVCPEWSDRFNGYFSFKDWAMKNGYREDLSLDRIDNNSGYYPDNCRWVTADVQANNKRSNVILTFEGKSQTLSQWADELNIPMKTLHARLYRHGWSIEKALTEQLKSTHSIAP